MKRFTVNFLRPPTEHEIAHSGDRGWRAETKIVDAKSKTAAKEFGKAISRAYGWRLMDIREESA